MKWLAEAIFRGIQGPGGSMESLYRIVAILKSVRKERMAGNFAIFGFELDQGDLATIAALDEKTSSFFDHRDPAMVSGLESGSFRSRR